MRLLYSIPFVLTMAVSLTAQDFATEVLAPLDFSANFLDVYVDADGNGWAVGNCNILASTQNSGQDWEILEAPEGLDYNAVACKPGTNCETVFLAADGIVLRSTDAGQSWTSFPLEVDDVREFHFVTDQIVVISHSNESLFRSTDGGDTWTETLLAYSYRGAAHFPTSDIGYLFQQSGGPLLKSVDAGATWDSIYQFESNALYGDWLDENIGFLYDQTRRIFKTTNGGSDWSLVADTGVPSNLRRMVALSETELVAYVFPSNIFRSEDGGATWVNNTTIGAGQFGLRFVGIHNNGSDFWIASYGTEILYSTDGLQTATSQFPAERPSFEQIHFASNEVGYALQERMGMFKTIDGGDSWTQLSNDFFTVSRDFLVLDEETVIIPYNSSGPQITEDGGDSWAPLFPEDIQDTTFVFSIEELSNGRLLLVGSEHSVYSDDGGDTWNVNYHGLNNFPRAMTFVDDQLGFVGSDGGRMWRTTDGGVNWELVINGDFTNQPISNLFVLDNGTVINTVSGTTRCSSDGGLTWNIESCAGVTAPGQIVVAPDGTYYSGRISFSADGFPTNVQRSTDQGQNWESIAGFCTTGLPGTVSPDGRYVYVYGSGGFLGRVDVSSVSTDDITAAEITTAKVYPNPTSGLLRIDLPEETTQAEAALYDLQGQQLLRQIGTTVSMDLDLSNLPSGMYLLKLQGDNWLQTARVVLE